MTIAIEEIGQLRALIADVQHQATHVDYQPILEGIQNDIAAGEASAFSAQSTPGGDAWAALAPSTVKRKGNSRILFETGTLMASLVNVGGPGNIHGSDRRGLIFGTDVDYSVFHETGTTTMPQRVNVGISEETLRTLVDKIADATVVALESR
jgi:phage gpG-like protein